MSEVPEVVEGPSLPAAPRRAVGPEGPRFGAWSGSLHDAAVASLAGAGLRGKLRLLLRRKRWQYALVADDRHLVALAVVDLGYAANGFAFACDLQAPPERALLFDRGVVGPPRTARVADTPGEGGFARFRGLGLRVDMARQGDGWRLSARSGRRMSLDLELALPAAPPLALVAPVPDGVVNVTQKSSLLRARGEVTIEGRRFSMDGGLGAIDYTQGLLARETAWRWAYGCGRDEDGQPLAFNLVEGFNQGAQGEDGLWWGDELQPLPRCTFNWQPEDTLRPWKIRSACGGVDLAFRPLCQHWEDRELGIARSRFVQVAGHFDGLIRTASGRVLRLAGLPGVTEDQHVRW